MSDELASRQREPQDRLRREAAELARWIWLDLPPSTNWAEPDSYTEAEVAEAIHAALVRVVAEEREALGQIASLSANDPWVESWKHFARGLQAIARRALGQPFDEHDLPGARGLEEKP